MIETHVITITAYRTPDGVPTCCIDPEHACVFLGWRKLGTQETCSAMSIDIHRDGNGRGYTMIPQNGCIVWPKVSA